MGTYDGTTVTVYVNGVSQDTASTSLNITSTNNFTIGKSASSTSPFLYTGGIDEVRVYNRALSAGEASTVATGTTPVTTPTGFVITSVETADTNSNGIVDALLFTFSAAIQDSTFTAALTAGDLVIAGVTSPTSDLGNGDMLDGDLNNNKIVVTINAVSTPVNSGVSYQVTYTRPATGGITSSTEPGAAILNTIAAGALTTTDAAKPVVVNYETDVRLLSIVVSENVTVTDLSRFYLNDVTGTNIVALTGATATVSTSSPWIISAKLTLSQLRNTLAISSDPDVGTTVSADPTVGTAGPVVLDVKANGITDMSSNTNATKDNTAVAETLDATDPLVTSVTATSGTFGPGDVIAIQVTFTEAVQVTGTPTIQLDLASPDVTTTAISGSGTSTLTFSYTVVVGDSTATGTFAEVLAGITGTVLNFGGNGGATTNASFDAAAGTVKLWPATTSKFRLLVRL